MTCGAPASNSACFLAAVRVVAIAVAPACRAIWIAARPTLLDAAGNDDEIAGGEAADVDQRAVGGQILHPQGRGLNRRDAGRRLHHGAGGDDRLLAVGPVRVHRERRHDADDVARAKCLDALADGIDDARRFIADPRRIGRGFEILARPEQRFRAVEADRLHADAHLSRTGFSRAADPRYAAPRVRRLHENERP